MRGVRYLSEEVRLILCLGGLFGGLIVFFIALFCMSSYLDCNGFATGTGIETRWRWGCYAKVSGQWVPKEFVFGRANEVRLKDAK